MAYSVQADLERVASAGGDSLVQLCDLEGCGQMDASAVLVMSSAIAAADAWINGYVAKQRSVPLSPVPPLIARYSAAESVYLLKVDRGSNVDRDNAAHMERENFLRDIASGRATLGVDPQPTKSALVSPGVLLRDDDESAEITSESTKGIW